MRINARQALAVLIFLAVISGLVILAKSVMSIHEPYAYTQFWNVQGSVIGWLWTAKWLFLFGALSTAYACYIKQKYRRELVDELFGVSFLRSVEPAAETIYILSLALAFVRGVIGEFFVRGVGFFVSIILVQFFNALLFEAWLGFGLFHLIQVWISGPVTDLITLGYLHNQINNPANWAVGLAIIAISGSAAQNRKAEGVLPQAMAWLLNMVLFYIMFTYGLLACFVIHTTWHVLTATITYLCALHERSTPA